VDGKPVALTLDFGPGMASRSVVTAWDPPRLFAREVAGWVPGSPPLATEFRVEARDGGVCIVRVVQSLFAETDDWDGLLTGTEEGWPGIFRILRLYIAHFRGRGSAIMQFMAPCPGTPADAWTTVTRALGLDLAEVGREYLGPANAPMFRGVVEDLFASPPGALLLLEEPAPGIAALGTIEFGESVFATFTFYLYGDGATKIVAQESPRWREWIQGRFSS
jgi:hypothetical protein